MNQFDGLDRALIDTSSLIYLSKIKLLNITSYNLQLMTVPGVFEEFGSLSDLKKIELIDINEVLKFKQETDRHLIETAKYIQVPVITEDKKILMQAKRTGLPFFNTLMVMNFLIYKKVISQTDYQTALDKLQGEAYYDAIIFEYGKKVYEGIIEKYENI